MNEPKISELKLDLLSSVSKVFDLRKEMRLMYVRYIELKNDNERLEKTNVAQKIQMSALENRLNAQQKREAQYQDRLLELEKEKLTLQKLNYSIKEEFKEFRANHDDSRDHLAITHAATQRQLDQTQTLLEASKDTINTLKQRCAQLETDRQNAIKLQQESIAVCERQQNDFDKKIAAANATASDAQAEASMYREQNESLRNQLKACEDSLSAASARAAELSQSNGQLAADIPEEKDKLVAYVIDLRMNNDNLQKQRDELQGRLEQMTRKSYEKKLEHSNAEADRKRLQNELLAAEEQIRLKEVASAEYIERISGLEKSIEELKREKDELKLTLQETTNQLCDQLAKSDIEQDQNTQMSMKELLEKNQQLSTLLHNTTDELRTETERVRRLSEEKKAMDETYTETISSSRDAIVQLNEKIKSLELELETVSKEKQLYQMLSENTRNPPASSNTASETPDISTVSNAPNDTSPVENTAISHTNVARAQGEPDSSICNELEKELERTKLELQQVEQTAAETSKRLKQALAEVGRWKENHDELVEVTEFNTAEVARIERHNALLQKTISSCEEALYKTNIQVEVQRREIVGLKADLSKANSLVDFKEKLLRERTEDKAMIQNQYSQLQAALMERISTIETVSQKGVKYLERIKSQEIEIATLKEQLQEAEHKVSAANSRDSGASEQSAKLHQAEVNRLHKEIEQLQETLKGVNEQKGLLEAQVAAQEKENGQDAVTAQREKLFQDLATANARIIDLVNQLAECQSRLDNSTAAEERIKNEYQAFVKKTEAQIDALQKSFDEQGGQLQELLGANEELQKDNEAKAEIEKTMGAEIATLTSKISELQCKIGELEAEASLLKETVKVQGNWAKDIIEKQALESNPETMIDDESRRLLEEERQKLAATEQALQEVQETLAREKEQHEAFVSRAEQELAKTKSELNEYLNQATGTGASQDVLSTLRNKYEKLQIQYSDILLQYEQAQGDLKYFQEQYTVTLEKLEKTQAESTGKLEEEFRKATAAKTEALVFKEQSTHLKTMIAKLQLKLTYLKKELMLKDKISADKAKKLEEANAIVEELRSAKLQAESVAVASAKENQRLQTLEGTITQLEAKLKDMQAAKEQVEGKLTELETSKENMAAQLKEAVAAKEQIEMTAKQTANTKDLLEKKFKVLMAAKAQADKKLKAALAAAATNTGDNTSSTANTPVTPPVSTAPVGENSDTTTPAGGTSHASDDKIEELKDAKEQLEKKLQEVEEEHAKLKQELQTTTTASNTYQKAHSDLQKKHQDLLARARKIATEKKTAVEELKQVREEVERLKKEMEGLKEQIQQQNQEIDRLKKEAEKAQKETDLSKEELQAAKKEAEKAQQEAGISRKRLEMVRSVQQKKIEQLNKELTQIKLAGSKRPREDDVETEPDSPSQKARLDSPSA